MPPRAPVFPFATSLSLHARTLALLPGCENYAHQGDVCLVECERLLARYAARRGDVERARHALESGEALLAQFHFCHAELFDPDTPRFVELAAEARAARAGPRTERIVRTEEIERQFAVELVNHMAACKSADRFLRALERATALEERAAKIEESVMEMRAEAAALRSGGARTVASQ